MKNKTKSKYEIYKYIQYNTIIWSLLYAGKADGISYNSWDNNNIYSKKENKENKRNWLRTGGVVMVGLLGI